MEKKMGYKGSKYFFSLVSIPLAAKWGKQKNLWNVMAKKKVYGYEKKKG